MKRTGVGKIEMKVLVAGGAEQSTPTHRKLVEKGREVIGLAGSDAGLERIFERGGIAVKVGAEKTRSELNFNPRRLEWLRSDP
jgi:hypothetical protein